MKVVVQINFLTFSLTYNKNNCFGKIVILIINSFTTKILIPQLHYNYFITLST